MTDSLVLQVFGCQELYFRCGIDTGLVFQSLHLLFALHFDFTMSTATKCTKNWSSDELDILVNAWAEDAVQAQLDGTTRNAKVFQELAGILAAAGYNRTPGQCRDKIKNLKRIYKAVKDNNNRSGRGIKNV